MGYTNKPRAEEFRCTAISPSTGERCRSRFTLKGSDPRKCNRHISNVERIHAAERVLEQAGDRVIQAWQRGEIPGELIPLELAQRARDAVY